MICDHEHNICFLEYKENLTLEEFIARLIHIFGEDEVRKVGLI